jgi:DNA-binding transcriptional ArsR family regulator
MTKVYAEKRILEKLRSTSLIIERLVSKILKTVLETNINILEPFMNDELIDKEMFQDASKIFRGLNNDLRLRLIHLIHLYQKITVKEMYITLRQEQSLVSHQLSILRSLKIVQSQKENNRLLYSLNYERLSQIRKSAANLILDKSNKNPPN